LQLESTIADKIEGNANGAPRRQQMEGPTAYPPLKAYPYWQPWTAIIWHVFWLHWKQSRGRTPLTKTAIKIKVGLEKRIKTDVLTESRPIIGISKMGIISMDDVHVPAHKAHLQAQHCWVVSLVRKNEARGITVRNPNKTLPE
jgi:hypothetical protein